MSLYPFAGRPDGLFAFHLEKARARVTNDPNGGPPIRASSTVARGFTLALARSVEGFDVTLTLGPVERREILPASPQADLLADIQAALWTGVAFRYQADAYGRPQTLLNGEELRAIMHMQSEQWQDLLPVTAGRDPDELRTMIQKLTERIVDDADDDDLLSMMMGDFIFLNVMPLQTLHPGETQEEVETRTPPIGDPLIFLTLKQAWDVEDEPDLLLFRQLAIPQPEGFGRKLRRMVSEVATTAGLAGERTRKMRQALAGASTVMVDELDILHSRTTGLPWRVRFERTTDLTVSLDRRVGEQTDRIAIDRIGAPDWPSL